MNYRIEVANNQQLTQAITCDDYEYIYAPIEILDEKTEDKFRIIITLPTFLADCEDKVAKRLSELKNFGFDHAMADTIGHVELIKNAAMKVHGGFRLNLTNSASVGFYEELGTADSIISIELTIAAAKSLKHKKPMGIIAYGHLPLMTTRRCPINDNKPCEKEKKCGKFITDRKGNRMRVLCRNTVEILNPDCLVLSDRVNDLSPFDFAVLKMTHEDNVNAVFEMYEHNIKPEGNLTRGLYYRGVQ